MLLQAIIKGGMLTLDSRLCPGPETGLHCRAGLIQSGVQNVQNAFEDGWCTPFAATGDHQGWHADSGQPLHQSETGSTLQETQNHAHTPLHSESTPCTLVPRAGDGSALPCRVDPKWRPKRAKTHLKTVSALLLLLQAIIKGGMTPCTLVPQAGAGSALPCRADPKWRPKRAKRI